MVNIYMYVCDYTDSEGINTIIAIQQDMEKNGIDSEIYKRKLADGKGEAFGWFKNT